MHPPRAVNLSSETQKLSAVVSVKSRKAYNMLYNIVSCLVEYGMSLLLLTTAPQPPQYEVHMEFFRWFGAQKNINLSLQCFFDNVILFTCVLLEDSYDF